MTLFQELHQHYTTVQYLEMLLRIIISALCGALIGLERSRRFKDAGLRTHCLVAASAAMMMIVSKYGFADMGGILNGRMSADAARLAAQVISGISFLCAGVIYKDRYSATKGLTTAAGIWAVAGIGLAIGSGMYIIGIFTTVFIYVLQITLHKHPVGSDRYTNVYFTVTLNDSDEALDSLGRQLDKWGVVVQDTDIFRKGDELQYDIQARAINSVPQKELLEFVRSNPEIHSMRMVDDQ